MLRRVCLGDLFESSGDSFRLYPTAPATCGLAAGIAPRRARLTWIARRSTPSLSGTGIRRLANRPLGGTGDRFLSPVDQPLREARQGRKTRVEKPPSGNGGADPLVRAPAPRPRRRLATREAPASH